MVLDKDRRIRPGTGTGTTRTVHTTAVTLYSMTDQESKTLA